MKTTIKPTIAVLGSHSALDVCRGAKDEGFRTLVIAQKGREKTYSSYYATHGNLGCVDECLVLDSFSEILSPSVQKKLKSSIFIANRSFEAYLDFDYEKIEGDFHSPMFGNKFLLKIEERERHPNQYDLLDEAGIRYPKHFRTPSEIDRLVIAKISDTVRKYERAFFLASDAREFAAKAKNRRLGDAVIEEFVLGTPVNFNFFYSPMEKRLELLGTDTRRQTNLDGILRLPATHQRDALRHNPLTFEESGHIAVTVLESMLEKAFALGEAFVRAAKKMYPPGVIGPFALQSLIVSGPPKKDIVVIDVSPRMPGSPGIAASPYAQYLFGEPLSVGRRVAKEIRKAYTRKSLERITT